MPRFIYTAENDDGQQTQGFLDAVDEAELRAALSEMDLVVRSIENVDASNMSSSVDSLPAQSHEDNTISDTTEDEDITESKQQSSEPWSMNDVPKEVFAHVRERTYFPIVSTLKLYTGWLMVCCVLLYAVTSYQLLRLLPFRLPYIDTVAVNIHILLFTFGWFLFFWWLCSDRFLRRNTLVSVGTFVLLCTVWFFFFWNV